MDNGDLLHLVGDQKNSQLLRDLAVGAPLFKVIHQNFAQVFDHMPGVCVISFYEALDSNAMKVWFPSRLHYTLICAKY